MRNKKIVEIKKFNNLNESPNDVKTKMFYNVLPGEELYGTHGIGNALFYKNLTNKTEKELNIDKAGIEKIEGLAYIKQYFPDSDRLVYRLLVYANDKRVYMNQMLDDNYDLFWLYSLQFNSAPIVLSYKKEDEYTIILASVDEMKIWKTNYTPYTITDVPIITSMCLNENILFCTIKNPAYKIWYAANLNFDKVGEVGMDCGYVTIPDKLGDARKILTFNEDVYVFSDYGISKINYYAENITVSQVYLSNTKIYADTVCVSGNNILFMTKDGLYSFNGVKVNKTEVEFPINVSINNDNAVAVSLGETYYLALKLDFNDNKQVLCEEAEYVNNALIIVNTSKSNYEIIRGVDIKTMLPVKTEKFEKVLVAFNSGPVNRIGQIDNSSKYIDVALPKYWISDSLFNNTNVKLLTKLCIKADEGVKFTLKTDEKEYSFVTYKSGINNFNFKICCKDAVIEITSTNDSAIVNKVLVEYYEY